MMSARSSARFSLGGNVGKRHGRRGRPRLGKARRDPTGTWIVVYFPSLSYSCSPFSFGT